MDARGTRTIFVRGRPLCGSGRAVDACPAKRSVQRRSLAFFCEAEFEKSLADLDQAVERAPNDPSPYLRRAETRSILNEMAETLDDVHRALELEPKNALHWCLRGITWFRIARKAWLGTKTAMQNAWEDYSEAIRLNPDDADTWQYRALVHWQRLELDAVIDDCSEAIRRQADHLDALRLRAQVYRRQKRFDDAAKDYLEIDRILESSSHG